MLFVDCQAVGVIKAKPVGTTLTGVEQQTLGYRRSYPGELPMFDVGGVLPFGYESTGVETRFTCGLDPVPASRRVFGFHRPETLARRVTDHVETGFGTLRAGLRLLPDLDPRGLWPAQAEAVRGLEASLGNNRPRALIQMATGSGKTFTAVNAVYRLVRHAGAQRVLFLVDRANLGRQAVREFEGFDTPDDGRKFTELYNVRRLTSSHLDMAAEGATKVHVSTIQRLYSLLRGEELDDALDEQSGFEVAPEQPVEVVYNPAVPVESYDVIVVDECHRSIYGVWRGVLEYFDAFLVGLTATPGVQTFAFFDQNLVTEYGHAEAVADRVNVDYDVFRIRTEITEGGGTVRAGFVTEFRDRLTRSQRLEQIAGMSLSVLARRLPAPSRRAVGGDALGGRLSPTRPEGQASPPRRRTGFQRRTGRRLMRHPAGRHRRSHSPASLRWGQPPRGGPSSVDPGGEVPFHISMPPHLRRSAYRRPDGPDRDALLRYADELEEKGDASLVSSAVFRAALRAHGTEDD
ncbi:MAG: DEAD/DEAH box helicase [Acidimicrobiia bacterium]|nr:DEAD/DEAH box helicase [Acidimicrobiia bacterium]